MTLVSSPRDNREDDRMRDPRFASPVAPHTRTSPSLGFHAVTASIDILVPPLFRRTNPMVRGDGEVTCVTYADPTMVPAADTGTTDSTSGAALRAGESRVTLRPAVRAHATDRSLGLGSLGSPDTYHFSYKPDEQQSVKQGLLEVLLGAGDVAAGDFGAGRPLPAPTLEEEVGLRLHGTHCDASYVTTPTLLLRMLGLILASRTNPSRLLLGCVTSVDLSHTVLGVVGAAGPTLRADGLTRDGAPPWSATDMRFYPDQPQPWVRCPEKVRTRLAARSLALCYVAPLLFVPGAQNYRIKQLVCTHCQLTDADAEGLAAVLRHKASDTYLCTLESIDLSFNRITDVGALELLHALRKNHTVTSLLLVGNPEVTRRKTLEDIEKRLDTIRRQKSKKRSWLSKMFAR